jgi:phosphoglycerol transferase MdoB-like AlkP superfamily enzyme
MIYKQILGILGIAMAVNGAMFAVYRVVFLKLFGRPAPATDTLRVLRSGLRLDVAWLGIEVAAMGVLYLLQGWTSPRAVFCGFWFLTGFHVLISVSNVCTYAERNQTAGELLLPYITSPYQVYLAVMPFVQRHWLSMAALLVAGTGYLWGGLSLSRFLPGDRLSMWNLKATSFGLGLMLVPVLLSLHFVARRKVGSSGVARGGWRLTTTKAKYYMNFTDYAFNQAVMNPLLEFLFQQVPSHFKRTDSYHLTESEALEAWRKTVRHTPEDERYPLLKQIRGQSGSPIENLVILQVEGFSQSVLEQQRNGREVMPFVGKLAREGYYFPNTFQCANFTSGGVFSTLASMPRATYDEPGSRFTSYELNGYYGSLPRILGAADYSHFFLFGFRQSCDDFTAFTANQGCRVVGYFDFVEIFKRKKKLAEADTLLGIFDGYFLDESAAILLECQHRFTAHLVTTTTHSPWAVPASFEKRFDEPAMNSFAYLDASIQRFSELLQRKPGLWEKTLLVILGDHTSVTFGNNWLERIRIPLVFYNPNLPPRTNPDPRWASQVDVLPTALGLLSGEHWYAGMGRSLLDPAAPDVGQVTGTSTQGYYLKNDFVLSYDPLEREARLFRLTQGSMTAEEMTGQHAETASGLRREYFAAVELAKRLAIAKQIFPMSASAGSSVRRETASR